MAQSTITIEITLRLVASEILARQRKVEIIAKSMRAWNADTTPGDLARQMRTSLFLKARQMLEQIDEEIGDAGFLLLALRQPANDEDGPTRPHAA